MIETFLSWSLPGQIAFGAALLAVLAGAIALVRRVTGRSGPGGAYPDQPTIPVLFQPQERSAAGDDVDLDDDWSASTGRSDGGSPSGMIGRVHGPPRNPERSAPEGRIRVAESRAETGEASSRRREGREGNESPERRKAPERPRARERPQASEDSRAPETTASEPVGPSSSATEFSMEDEDHTLQLLPGRMEVVAGGDRGREIRFIRVPGNTYTFGRRSGSEASHIQLQNATVSREHAAMKHVNGRWRIRNLSRTNPLRINGEAADTPGKEYTLQDGDRVEMGEVAFLFREK